MVSEAREIARSALAEALPRRWEHVQGVAGKAERVSASLALSGDVLVSAAWLHDIGYAPGVVETSAIDTHIEAEKRRDSDKGGASGTAS